MLNYRLHIPLYYLLGFDNHYKYEIDKDGKVIETDQKNTHFFKDDVTGERWVVGNTDGMERCYIAFKEYADKHNIKVLNISILTV